jgi:asparagine synthase (glutamine-hydrolysing)
MIALLTHRGPDAGGTWNGPGVALGNRRLKILDPSDAANQPFGDGEDMLVFNGRIFNHPALRARLESRYSFRTSCDTEVLFRALQAWGPTALDEIQGQFAFAYYCRSAATLLIARDHAGICPLYTRQVGDRFYFASEIRPLLSLGPSPLDRAGVVDYFTYRYNIQNGRTLFADVKRFPPAHAMTIDLATGGKSLRRYWRAKIGTETGPEEMGACEEAFSNLMDAEVSSQKTADVPVGIYLSGGIDSAALLTGYARTETPITSYTLQFSGTEREISRVRELARLHTFSPNVFPFLETDLDDLGDVVETLEEPFGDLIICANNVLARRASQDVRVVLSGEGGDEAFCGYDHQRSFSRMLGLSGNPIVRLGTRAALAVLPAVLARRLQSYPGGFGGEELRRVRKVFSSIQDPLAAYLNLVSLFGPDEIRMLLNPSFRSGAPSRGDVEPFREIFGSGPVWAAMMRSEIEQLTLIVNLLKQDRFSMRYSMEGCVPLVSKPIMEFASSLPLHILLGGVNKQILLRYSGRQPIPKEAFSLFNTPAYLARIEMLFDRFVTEEAVREAGVLEWNTVVQLRRRLRSGTILAVKQSMSVLVFMAWWMRYRNHLR